MFDVNWNQLKAGGKHVASYAAGGVTVAVGLHFLSPGQGTELTADIDQITDGLTKVAAGVAGIIGALTPIYTAWRAAHNASPSSQIKSVAATLSEPNSTQAANALADPASRNTIIQAVAAMPEVRGVVTETSVATAIPSEKVVSTPQAIAALPPAAPAQA